MENRKYYNCELLLLLLIFLYLFLNSTFPPLNILLYNAITGNGDELYGIEPLSYYVKNLLLTMGVAFPFACVECFLYLTELFRYIVGSSKSLSYDRLLAKSALCLPVMLWMGLLFSRPHKVTSYLFPVFISLTQRSIRFDSGRAFYVSHLSSTGSSWSHVLGATRRFFRQLFYIFVSNDRD